MSDHLNFQKCFESEIEKPSSFGRTPNKRIYHHHKCSFCGIAFSKKISREKHERTVHAGEDHLFKCAACNRGFPTSLDCEKHEHRHIKYSCRYCTATLSSDARRVLHERKHTGSYPYKCSFCPRSFPLNSSRRDHERSHTGELPYLCSFCDTAFISKRQCTIHERATHVNSKPFKCCACQRTFVTIDDKTSHICVPVSALVHVCQYCDRKFESENSCAGHESRVHVGKPRPYQCIVCQMRFVGKIEKLAHICVPVNYACAYCEQNFSNLTTCRTHEQTHVLPAAPALVYACNFCDCKFESNDSCVSHECSNHLEEARPYKCKDCHMRFADRIEKVVHACVPMTYACVNCERTFTNLIACRTHEETHVPTELPDFKCRFCEKSFVSKLTHANHERYHNRKIAKGGGYKCSHCEKCFVSLKVYLEHKKLHTNKDVYKYECSTCNETFDYFKLYREHKIMHKSGVTRKVEPTTLDSGERSVLPTITTIKLEPDFNDDIDLTDEIDFTDEIRESSVKIEMHELDVGKLLKCELDNDEEMEEVVAEEIEKVWIDEPNIESAPVRNIPTILRRKRY